MVRNGKQERMARRARMSCKYFKREKRSWASELELERAHIRRG